MHPAPAMKVDALVQQLDYEVTLGIVQSLLQKVGNTMERRAVMAQLAVQSVNNVLKVAKPTSDPVAEKHAESLRIECLSRLGSVLTEAQVGDMLRYFESRPCFNGHVHRYSDGTPRMIGAGAEDYHYGCYSFEDVIQAPHLLELANQPTMLRIAQQYLGCVPTLYSLNAWWSFSGHGRAERSQEFHRDNDDYKFCTFFIFLTDVALCNGAHLYIRKSHDADRVKEVVEPRGIDPRTICDNILGYGQDPFYEDAFKGYIETITGPAGTGFIADTFGLHKGVPLTEGRRLMLWARYGVHRNQTSYDEIDAVARERVINRVPKDAGSAYVNRCLIR